MVGSVHFCHCHCHYIVMSCHVIVNIVLSPSMRYLWHYAVLHSSCLPVICILQKVRFLLYSVVPFYVQESKLEFGTFANFKEFFMSSLSFSTPRFRKSVTWWFELVV